VVQGQDAGGDAGRVLAVFGERRREDQVLADGDVLGRVDLLLHDADEAVDVVQPVVLDVERVSAEARAVSEQDAFGAWIRDVDQRPDRVGAVADVDGLLLRDVGGVGEITCSGRAAAPAAVAVSG